MKLIQLNHGYSSMVDDDDFEFLSKYKWGISARNRTLADLVTFNIQLHDDGERDSLRALLRKAAPHVEHSVYQNAASIHSEIRAALAPQPAVSEKEKQPTADTGKREG